MESLEEFLKSRGIPESTIFYFKQENIDVQAIHAFDESELKKYIPKLGDRMAILDFCKRQLAPKKYSIIEKIKNKIAMKSKQSGEEDTCVIKKIKKKNRFIELGWLCCDNGTKMVQVRSKQGGGTRKVCVDQLSSMEEIEEKAKSLFFPNGESVKGCLSEYTTNLLDFKYNAVERNWTVEEVFRLTCQTRLRFYLATFRKNPLDDKKRKREGKLQQSKKNSTRPERNELDLELDSGSDFEVSTKPTLSKYVLSDDEGSTQQQEVLKTFEVQEIEEDPVRSYLFSVLNEKNEYDDNTLNQTRETTLGEYSFSNFHEIEEIPPPPEQLMTLPEPEIVEKLVLHRGKVFFELIESAKNRNIDFQALQIEMILPNGCSEQAEDMGGVLRDTISEFFISFYELCTMGAQFKIPSLRHDFQEEEWSAIGKIIQQSFIAQKYFPIKLAPVFLKSCFEEHPNEEEMLENFLKYVSFSDAAVLKTALKNFEDADSEELLEFCTSYNAKCIPTKENFKKMLLQIAKEELIQKPSFVKECFYPHLKRLKHVINLEEINLKYLPTDKNIIAMFNTDEDLTSEKKQILSYLKKYIKESDEKIRSSFLRFATGSDLANHPIKIDFINSEGFTRSPIAHTCTGLLQLPLSYENFIAFRNEFNNLLSADVWVMDIV